MLPFLSVVRAVAVAVLSPPRCAACDVPTSFRAIFCGACAATVVQLDTRRPFAAAPFVYGGAVAELLTRFKYAPAPHLAGAAYGLLQRCLPRLLARVNGGSNWVVCPVPLHPRRLEGRGFNQAALLARPLAAALGAPFDARLLRRVRDTPRQASLDRRARLANVEGAFSLRSDARARGRSVLLVDDVVTTGATFRACAAALWRGGARSVEAVAVAAADNDVEDQGSAARLGRPGYS